MCSSDLSQLFQNRGDGTFREVSGAAGPYFAKPLLGRGLATGDLDRDGRLDVVAANQLDSSAVLRNESEAVGGALVLRLVGVTCGRTPVGVRVRVVGVEPTLWQQLVGGGSYQSANSAELHLGGLNAGPNELEIDWPDGVSERIGGVTAGTWCLRQGAGAVQMKW